MNFLGRGGKIIEPFKRIDFVIFFDFTQMKTEEHIYVKERPMKITMNNFYKESLYFD